MKKTQEESRRRKSQEEERSKKKRSSSKYFFFASFLVLVILSFASCVKYDLLNNSSKGTSRNRISNNSNRSLPFSLDSFDKLSLPLRKSYDLIDRYVPTFHPRAKLRAEMNPAAASLSNLLKSFDQVFSQPNLKPLASPPEDLLALIEAYTKWTHQAEVMISVLTKALSNAITLTQRVFWKSKKHSRDSLLERVI